MPFRLLQEHEKKQQQRNLPPTPAENQRLLAENNALKQRLQETGARSENELEQWRKVVEQEKARADQGEKAAQVGSKHDTDRYAECETMIIYADHFYYSINRSYTSAHNISRSSCNSTFNRFKLYSNSSR